MAVISLSFGSNRASGVDCDTRPTDGTVIWTAPNGKKHVTHPGGPLVFAALGIPTGPLAHRPRDTDRGGDKTAITAQRRANSQHRERRTDPTPRSIPDEYLEYDDTFTTATDSDPPPF
ncbi:MAG: hypothetical protein QOH27_5289 [Mycobacterium sp.]|nr:hypothetical protein [Mycobacterium sp.]